jgi:TFIIF-interacting CTD phosphatase-like protein
MYTGNIYRLSKKEPIGKPITQKCIILDLDETLVHSSENFEKILRLKPFDDPAMFDLRNRLYDLCLSGYSGKPNIWGITRPHLEEFIMFCFGYFQKVCVWSAGTPEYVKKIVEYIFPPGYQPHVVYTRIDCSYAQNGKIFKPISKMLPHKECEGVMKLENTLFVDDQDHAFIKNPYNGIVIPPYDPDVSYHGLIHEDRCLLDLMDWLMRPEVIASKDVRYLEKDYIFTSST